MYSKLSFVLLFLLILQDANAQTHANIDSVFVKKFQYSMISRGDNYPDFSSRKDSMDYFLFCLHQNIPLVAFMEKTNFSKEKVNEITSFLESKDWLHKIGDVYKPSIFIANNRDGDSLFKYAAPISEDITSKIISNLPKIKDLFQTTNIAKTDSFDTWSFFILSDVLLDSWQIDNVEKNFLKRQNRPMRHGKYYFQEIVEWNNQEREAFGIYGNMMIQTKDEKTFSIYGNNRGQKLSRDLFEHKVSMSDNIILEKIADSFLPDLLAVLENYRAYSEQTYEKLGYSKEISYDEFFIWWYHFIYTQTTNELFEKGYLSVPHSGNFYYEMLPS